MRKYILIPDSFKGTLSSVEICNIVKDEINKVDPNATVVSIPVADGGEGTVDAFLAAVGGKRVEIPCKGPYMEDIMGFYGMLEDGTAIIEMAAAAGLPMVGDHRNPEKTSTYGVGELIEHAAKHGAKKIVLALGGSATNDGGCGAASAIGVVFRKANGEDFIPTGETLMDIASISLEKVDPEIKEVPFVTMCDIDNPMCGEYGASAVFGPQKGADADMVKRLDAGLQHLAEVIRNDLGTDVENLPGSGAAGGFGGGSVAFMHSSLRMGIDIVLDVTAFDEKVQNASLVITGEGKMDSQSLRGKVVIGVARRAKKHKVPVAALVGGSELDIAKAYEEGVSGVFPINPLPEPYETVKHKCREHLQYTAHNLITFYCSVTE